MNGVKVEGNTLNGRKVPQITFLIFVYKFPFGDPAGMLQACGKISFLLGLVPFPAVIKPLSYLRYPLPGIRLCAHPDQKRGGPLHPIRIVIKLLSADSRWWSLIRADSSDLMMALDARGNEFKIIHCLL